MIIGPRFVTVDGPNGVGKSTISKLLAAHLSGLVSNCIHTREPTNRFDRSNEEKHGAELARLIWDDRHYHVQHEIGPALAAGAIVICERYTDSSLVYRYLDGIPFEETWEAHACFPTPELSVLLTVSVDTIRERLARRTILTRYERRHDPEEELRAYREAHTFLRRHGYRCIEIENRHEPEFTARRIVRAVLSL